MICLSLCLNFRGGLNLLLSFLQSRVVLCNKVDTDVEGENEEKFEHFDGFSFAGTGDFEEDNSDEEEDDDEVYDHDGGDSKDGGGSDRGGDNEGSEKQKKKGNKGGHGRKRNSEGDDANEGDVFVDPGTGNTVCMYVCMHVCMYSFLVLFSPYS